MTPLARSSRRFATALAAALLTVASPAWGTPPVPTDPASNAILARPPGTPLYNWLSNSFPTILIVAGGLIVLIVLRARAKVARMPQPPTLEERFARLAAESRARDAASDGGPPPLRLSPSAARSPQAPDRRLAADRPDSLDGVMRDAEELAQRLAAAMDLRADRLEALIRDADDRLRRLEAARSAIAPGSAAGHALDEPAFEKRRADPPRTIPGQALAPARAPAPSFDAEAHDPIHRQVFELADQGLGSLEIARTLGQPTGQVELILALRGR